MKIIQSFWTGKNKNLDFNYGWISPKYNYLSWILSSNQLKKFYNDVELFTDEFGYEILIKSLKLPYSKVHVVLDDLNVYDDNLWALAKIKSYGLMTEPFLHVDGDVFIFESFSDELLSKAVITQNVETTSGYYWKMWQNIRPQLSFLPHAMSNYDKKIHSKAFNMGIFGGNDISFIKSYVAASFDFVNKNKDSLSKINAYNFNIFFEQVLLYELSVQNNIPVDCLIYDDIGDNEYKGFGNFEEVPAERKYLHLLGFYKQQDLVCNKMDIYVQKYYPEFYEFLENLLNLEPKLSSDFSFSYKSAEIPLLTDNYLNAVIFQRNTNTVTKNIFCRNVLSEGMVTEFINKIKQNEDFYLIPLTNYSVNEDYSELTIELLYGESFKISLLSLDYVIFNLLNKPERYRFFIRDARQFVDDDFPEEEMNNFIDLLWQRISIFISYGIFYPLSTATYKQLIKDNAIVQ